MQYRVFPKIPDKPISVLGLGMMRLPVVGGESSKIDEDAAEQVFLTAVERGINYIDTAYPYHGGHSEGFTGKVIQKHKLRDSLYIATKSPIWLVQEAPDWDRYLNEQLERLRTDHVDFYLFHAMNQERWEKLLRLGGLEWAERARREGRIRHIGFSFHDQLEVFKTIVDGYEGWEFCQIQLNYLDTEYQAGLAGLHYAAQRNIGVIIMEGLRGGALARLPAEAASCFERTGHARSAVEWALRFLFDMPEVVTVLSGMGSMDQVIENCRVAEEARPHILSEEEKKTYVEAAQAIRARMPVPCTSCGYCRPCPQNVAINEIFGIYNSAVAFEQPGDAFWYKKAYVDAGTGADACVACGACPPKCPQGIDIITQLQNAHQYLMKALTGDKG
ncbi:MAG: aldo/keto reductase [Treponemataceae bacterium]|nr:aldo/keto reductase [Treponemataceae bacterium]